MTQTTPSVLEALSEGMADAVEGVAASVVQVSGGGPPASGLVFAEGVVVTTTRALGREETRRVRAADGQAHEAELTGWDPATGLAVLRVDGLSAPPVRRSTREPRVGQLGLALARSWSNAVTATAGLVSVIGGPLPTGRRRAIERVIRTSAPMHDGFSGGAFLDPSGDLLGVATAASIRGLGVVIPAAIAWPVVETLLEHGSLKRGYLGLAGQPVTLPAAQRNAEDEEAALLVVAVTGDGPASRAGVLVGDVIRGFGRSRVTSPEDLIDLLGADRIGETVALQVLRAGEPIQVEVTVGERQA